MVVLTCTLFFIRLQHTIHINHAAKQASTCSSLRGRDGYMMTFPLVYFTDTGNYHKQNLLWAYVTIGAG
jgi:hypothetical protein